MEDRAAQTDEEIHDRRAEDQTAAETARPEQDEREQKQQVDLRDGEFHRAAAGQIVLDRRGRENQGEREVRPPQAEEPEPHGVDQSRENQ